MSEEELIKYRLAILKKLKTLYNSQFERLKDVLEQKCVKLITAADNAIATRLAALPAGAISSITPQMSAEALSSAAVFEGETVTPILAITDREIMVKHHKAELDRHEWLVSLSKAAIRDYKLKKLQSTSTSSETTETTSTTSTTNATTCIAQISNEMGENSSTVSKCTSRVLPLSSYCLKRKSMGFMY